MWSIKVRSDVGKQLEALQKAYREEDIKERRDRKERQDAQAAQAAALTAATGAASAEGAPAEGEEGGPKKKKKKEGPGVTARNMSEDVRKKMSNAVASQAAGLGTGKYAWMSAASAAAPAKPKPAPRATTPATTTAPASGAPAGGWARPYQSSKTTSQQAQKDDDGRLAVTLRDAVFVVNNEKGHGGGRGSARGWT